MPLEGVGVGFNFAGEHRIERSVCREVDMCVPDEAIDQRAVVREEANSTSQGPHVSGNKIGRHRGLVADLVRSVAVIIATFVFVADLAAEREGGLDIGVVVVPERTHHDVLAELDIKTHPAAAERTPSTPV